MTTKAYSSGFAQDRPKTRQIMLWPTSAQMYNLDVGYAWLICIDADAQWAGVESGS